MAVVGVAAGGGRGGRALAEARCVLPHQSQLPGLDVEEALVVRLAVRGLSLLRGVVPLGPGAPTRRLPRPPQSLPDPQVPVTLRGVNHNVDTVGAQGVQEPVVVLHKISKTKYNKFHECTIDNHHLRPGGRWMLMRSDLGHFSASFL